MAEVVPSAGLIPTQLLSNIKKGDCVLFLGADLPLGYKGAPQSLPELTAALAAEFGLPGHLPWPETVRAYLSSPAGGRKDLISFIAGRCSGAGVQPGPLHYAIARVGFRAIVSAWYDDLLEDVLKQAGKRVCRVTHAAWLPRATGGEDETTIIKLYGSLSEPDSLVLDVWDMEERLVQIGRDLESITALCALRPPLFVGFDLMDRIPIHLDVRVAANMVRHRRQVYAAWPHSLEAVEAAWRGRNVKFVQAEATPFLESLASQLPVPSPSLDVPGGIRVHRPPYKFLDYYEPADADIFCGRDTEAETVTRLVLSHRLVTVFGPSGAGKTSLLLAGVLPRMTREGYQYVYVRALDGPITSIRKAVAACAGRTDWKKGANLRAFLETMLAAEDKLVIVLDQTEQIFSRMSSRNRLGFFGELALALESPEREVRFVLCLREDYLPCLDEARCASPLLLPSHVCTSVSLLDVPPSEGEEGHAYAYSVQTDRRAQGGWLPEIYSNSYRLTMLDPGKARLAIIKPAERVGVTVEPALADALVGSDRGVAVSADGDQEQSADHLIGDLVEGDGCVAPGVLQIVLDRLYREALPAGHSPTAPPPPDLALTLEAYHNVHYQRRERWDAEDLYGAKAILSSYVHEGLSRLPHLMREDDAPLGADPDLGAGILKVMVTSRAARAALTQEGILLLLEDAGLVVSATAAQLALVDNTRLGLEQVRLLRRFEQGGVILYELAHDYLVTEIAAWISEAERQAGLVRELLHRQMDNWRHAGLLFPLETLQLIHDRRKDLGHLNRDELELILQSALAVGYEVAYWLERARKGGVQVHDIALARLEDVNFRIRVAAVTALGRIGGQFVEPITRRLSDDYPQVRVAAITALENLQPDGAWRSQLTHERYVPAGEFVMGDGKESHKVHVGAFYIGRFPVANAEYKRFTDDVGRDFEVPAGKENHPVVNVSWFDARDCASWASMRLLTEAEWEKAASWDTERGKKHRYPWGNEFGSRRCSTEEMGIPGTTPVGRFSPQGDSPCGCADMAGNVWEWTGSLYRSYPCQPDDGREDLDSPDMRVVRGGAFNNSADFARTTHRSRNSPDLHLWNLGFRLGFSAAVHDRPAATTGMT